MNMPNSVDIDLLPLYRRAGQDQSVLPGLLAARPPRRCARSREADQLIIYLTLTGNVTLPLDLTNQLLDGLVKTYYDTSGSATAALRVTADALNQKLLQRNLRSSSGQQTIGMLTLATLRAGQLYLAQSGLVYALYLTDGSSQELYDPGLSGRGLGTNQSLTLRYFHASLLPRDMLLLAVQPPTSWNAQALTSLYGQSIDYQQRRLLEPVMDANGVLFNIKPGAGQVVLLPARPVQPARVDQSQTLTPASPAATAYPSAALPVVQPQLVDDQEDLVREQALLDQYQPLPELDILPENGLPLASEALSVSSSARGDALSGQKAAAVEATASPEPARKAAPKSPGIGRRIGRTLQSWFNRLLPEETLAAIPNSVFAFMAVAVPLVIVAMATAVYFQRGLAAQSEVAYQQAVQAVQQAQVQTEVSAAKKWPG